MLTSLDFLAPGQPWPPASEVQRLKDYAENKLLFEGEHPAVFNDWYRILREDQNASLEFVINLFKRLSTLWADLLVGEPPAFMAGDEESDTQKACDRIVADNALPTVAYEVALDTSRYGDGLFRIRLRNRKAVIEGQPPAFWFPVASPANLREIQAHVLAWPFEVVTSGFANRKVESHYLRVEVHTRGRIEHRVYRLKANATNARAIGEQVNGAQFESDWIDGENTLVDDFLIVPVAGLRTTDRYFGLDDYGDLTGLIREMEVRVAQISRILDKHADPSMFGPIEALTVDPKSGATSFKAGGRYFPTDGTNANPAGYITWEGQLDAAFTELDQLIHKFYIVSETSPAAFGQLEQGLAESGSALRRLMMAPLAKVNRVRLRFDPTVRRAIQVAAALEKAHGAGTPELPDLRIAWRDGLPEDEGEIVTNEVAAVTGGIRSKYLAVKKLNGGSERETQEELDRIDEDKASAAALAPAMPPGGISQRRQQEGDE